MCNIRCFQRFHIPSLNILPQFLSLSAASWCFLYIFSLHRGRQFVVKNIICLAPIFCSCRSQNDATVFCVWARDEKEFCTTYVKELSIYNRKHSDVLNNVKVLSIKIHLNCCVEGSCKVKMEMLKWHNFLRK
jgi:hypothetical protein